MMVLYTQYNGLKSPVSKHELKIMSFLRPGASLGLQKTAQEEGPVTTYTLHKHILMVSISTQFKSTTKNVLIERVCLLQTIRCSSN